MLKHPKYKFQRCGSLMFSIYLTGKSSMFFLWSVETESFHRWILELTGWAFPLTFSPKTIGVKQFWLT